MFDLLCRAAMAITGSRSAVADLMASEPASWKQPDKHHCVHQPTGVTVWVSNEAYGLHVQPGLNANSRDYWKPSGPERTLIWKAYKRHIFQKPESKARPILRAIQRHLDRDAA